jgi:hypothetical protein
MQNGSLIETKRRNGQSVWEFRWRDRISGKAVWIPPLARRPSAPGGSRDGSNGRHPAIYPRRFWINSISILTISGLHGGE